MANRKGCFVSILPLEGILAFFRALYYPGRNGVRYCFRVAVMGFKWLFLVPTPEAKPASSPNVQHWYNLPIQGTGGLILYRPTWDGTRQRVQALNLPGWFGLEAG